MLFQKRMTFQVERKHMQYNKMQSYYDLIQYEGQHAYLAIGMQNNKRICGTCK